MTLGKILNDVVQERERQDKKWGIQNHPFEIWCPIFNEEWGETNTEFLRRHFGKCHNGKEFREELVQCTAVLVAMLECGDRNGWFGE